MIELVKEAICRIFWIPVWFGFDGDFRATKGTLWWRFLNWLYVNGEPEFEVIWPDEESR